MTYSGLTDFERQVEQARQNNLDVEAERELASKEEAAAMEAAMEAAVESGEKQGPTLEPGPTEKFNQYQAPGTEGTSGGLIVNPVDTFKRLSLPTKGLIDTIGNAIGMVPWLKPVDDALDKVLPKEDDPAEQLARDISGLVVPAMLGNAGVLAASDKVNKAVMLSSRTKVGGEIAARLGVEAGVAYTAQSSAEDENMAQTLNETFGMSLPNATSDDDSPATRRKKHALEAAGFFGLTEVLGLGLNFYKKTRLKGTDDVSEAIVQSNNRIDPENPLESSYEAAKAERQEVLTEEMVRRLEAGPGAVGPFGDIRDPSVARTAEQAHDPFIHKFAEPHETYVPNAGANALEHKLDIAEEVYNPNYPSNGRSVPLATASFERKFMGITTPGDRKDALDELFNTIAPSVDAIKNGQPKYTSDQINDAVDVMVDRVFSPDVGFEEFEDLISDMAVNVYQKQKYLGEEEFVIASKAFNKAFFEMFDPNSVRASALLSRDLAASATDIARGIDLIPNKNTANLQAKMMEKLELMASEIRANQYIAGKSLEYKKLVKGGGKQKQISEWMQTQAAEFAEGLQAARQKGLQTVKSFKEIASEYPEYLKVFAEAVDHTNGKVDTLAKLKAYADKNIGVLKQAVWADPEVPSWFIRGLTGVRYNAMLSGRSAINAMEGNLMGLALKPVTSTLGAAFQRDGGQLSRALATYGGISENFKRAFKHMREEYKFAVTNPEAAMMKGREDLIQKHLDNFEIMEEMDQIWQKEGQIGKHYMWNMSKALYGFNNSKFVRYGLNAMYALDGFTNSMVMSANARSKAYDDLIGNRANFASGEDFSKAFRAKSDEVYSQFFDANGALKQELPGSVKYQAGELEFNLDDEVASQIARLTEKSPIFKALFAFPRTGINALKYTWSFNPVGGVFANATGQGKMGAVFNAKTDDQILDALKMHGIDELDVNAFKAIKSEYIGRQMVGSGVVTAGAMWALEGNLRGNGPQSGRDRKAMQKLGWKARTIKNPFTGKWVSYENREPLTTLLATVGDIVYYGTRVDSSITEQWFQKTVHALVAGPTSSTFLQGVEDLASLINGDEGAWNRLVANTATSQVPQSGLISSFNRIVTPQLKDVQNDIGEYTKNRYKGLLSGNEYLVDLLDVYTGKPINYVDPINAMMAEVLPFYVTNTGEEEFRFKLIESGWKGMPAMMTNPDTGSPIHPEERYFINNWVAQNYPLRERVEALFDPNTAEGVLGLKSLDDYRKARGQSSQRDFPIKNTFLHDQLDKIHNEAFDMAYQQLRNSYDEYTAINTLRKAAKAAQERADIVGAKEKIDKAQEIEESFVKKLRADFKASQN